MNSDESQINKNEIQGKTIINQTKSYTQGSIDNNNNNFYFFTFNNVNDFSSNYSNNGFNVSNEKYADNYAITANNNSPLNFLDNIEIKEIRFIPGTRFGPLAIWCMAQLVFVS